MYMRHSGETEPRGTEGINLAGPNLPKAEDCAKVYARNGVVAHLQTPKDAGTNRVLCNLPPSWPEGWLGLSGDSERAQAAKMPPCRRCSSVLAFLARGSKRVRKASPPRKPRRTSPAAATVPMREPSVMVMPGGPTVLDVSDEAAAFALRREQWDLPVIARFTVDGEPVSKARARFTKTGSKTQAYTPEKTNQAEQMVGWKFRQVAPQHKLDAEKTYGVIALFFCGTRQRRDVDNMLKLVLDGLNKVAWPDDEQVTEVSARKTLTLPGHARTEIAVYQVGEVQRFTDKCEHCGSDYPTFQCMSGKRKYCSKLCADAARRQTPLSQVTCEGCGSGFTGSPKRKFCSADCRLANGRTTVACTGCGTEFTKQRCHVRAANYCTGKCRDAANAGRRQQSAKGICQTCGGPTSKKTYKECRVCHSTGTNVTGKPKAVAA